MFNPLYQGPCSLPSQNPELILYLKESFPVYYKLGPIFVVLTVVSIAYDNIVLTDYLLRSGNTVTSVSNSLGSQIIKDYPNYSLTDILEGNTISIFENA